MTVTRRQALRLFGLGAAVAVSGASGCSLLGGTPQPRLLPSTAPLPAPFTVPLPLPEVARPYRSDGTTDHYELVQRAAELEILPGLRTPVWGYGGSFPGPTIEARSGRRTVVRVSNGLGVPTVTHLHGGRTPPESDGYPTDLVRPGSRRDYAFPLDQRAATLWYHDHRMDYTGQQVWRGLAGFFLVGDDEEEALPLPRGERDVPLMICDRSFAEDGSMPYPGFADRPGVREPYMGGVLGDVILVNGAPWPELRVERARYRLRLLNGSNARPYELSLSTGGAVVQIGSDGGLLTAPRELRRIRLAPGERADVVVDFSAYRVGDLVELRNLADEGPQGRVMRFAVDRDARDDSAIPKTLSRIERLDPAKAAATRDFAFTSGSLHGGVGWLINGHPFDAARTEARPKLGDTEIWRLTSDVAHPVHLHLAHFQVLTVNGERPAGPPEWKDTVELREAQIVEIITRFTGYRGRYVMHCHNLEHEDMAMMANFEVV
ncbi:multicopper oxidase family protein [Planomonospora sp. ID67723]|uniref:multicopper oxidase family protein n=1 Tax=Planomonospora sp. ID67723 TaxID=2738134 RepID=UPI0018C35CA8|nr:multicopper oxidase family protein [Planomonospora sp. ID67723]MBG0826680.1 multicopper oxidase family protein [Planomonospora sp. ID67723]